MYVGEKNKTLENLTFSVNVKYVWIFEVCASIIFLIYRLLESRFYFGLEVLGLYDSTNTIVLILQVWKAKNNEDGCLTI